MKPCRITFWISEALDFRNESRSLQLNNSFVWNFPLLRTTYCLKCYTWEHIVTLMNLNFRCCAKKQNKVTQTLNLNIGIGYFRTIWWLFGVMGVGIADDRDAFVHGNYYTPRRQVSRRWRRRPWWLWSHRGDSPPSRRAPSMLSSRRRVSSDRSSSARGRRRGTESDRDHLPPGASGLASSLLLLGSTGSKLMPWHSRASSWGLASSSSSSVGGEDCSSSSCRLPSGLVVGSAADGLLLAARSGRPWGTIG